MFTQDSYLGKRQKEIFLSSFLLSLSTYELFPWAHFVDPCLKHRGEFEARERHNTFTLKM